MIPLTVLHWCLPMRHRHPYTVSAIPGWNSGYKVHGANFFQ
jgi:hypothetical protein